MSTKRELYEQAKARFATLEQEDLNLSEQIEALRQLQRTLRLEKTEVRLSLSTLESEALLEEETARLRSLTSVDYEAIAPELALLVEATPELKPFQIEDCAFMLDRMAKGMKVLNANDMGLGKTIETIAVLKTLSNPTVLWVTKKSLVHSACTEAKRWGLPLVPLTGNTEQKDATLSLLASMAGKYPIYVACNYETFNTNKSALLNLSPTHVVIDEVHRLKGGASASGPSLIWQNVKDVLHPPTGTPPYSFFLSGNPVQNKPGDMWAYLHLFEPEKFPSLRKFENFFGKGILGMDNQAVMKVLAPNMIRRRKDEVGIQIPIKTKQIHEIEIPARSEFAVLYKKLAEDLVADLPEGELSISNLIAQMHYLRLLPLVPGTLPYNFYPVDPITLERQPAIRLTHEFKPAYPKLDYAFELACEILDQGENVIIWSAQFNAPLKYLDKLFTELGYTTGTISGATKDYSTVVDDFQQNRTRVLFCNMKAAAEGYNLQRSDSWPGGASQAIFLDEWYNPALNEQAEDRIWRVGSIVPVTIHVLRLTNSADDIVAAICEDKTAWADTLMEDKKLRPASEWKDMIQRIIK